MWHQVWWGGVGLWVDGVMCVAMWRGEGCGGRDRATLQLAPVGAHSFASCILYSDRRSRKHTLPFLTSVTSAAQIRL